MYKCVIYTDARLSVDAGTRLLKPPNKLVELVIYINHV